jgi:RND family efflux transporter MFP subunit
MTKRSVISFNKTLLMASMATLLSSGCATFEPEALQPQEIKETLSADRVNLTRDIEPLAGPLTLEETIARAIKYNADRRYKAMEEAVAQGNLDVGKFDMLPKLVASAGYRYRYRDKDLTTRSENSVTGAPSLANPYISSSREAITTDLGFSWSLLDFGQSYFAARQNADRVLIASEHRRKATHTLIQDVRTAYWRVIAAEKLGKILRSTLAEAENSLTDARKVEGEKLRSPLDPLRYQRQLLENIRLLEMIDLELSTARIELASLAALPLPSASALQVVEPTGSVGTTWLSIPVEQMEEQALQLNPDLRESLYSARIARQETRRALLKLFPGISFNYAQKTSDDRFLVHQVWNEAGAQISFNLLGLLSAPAQMRLADAGVAMADQKRMSTQMAVLTQLHIARPQYANALRLYQRSDTIAGVDQRIVEHTSNQEIAERQTKLERVSQQTAAILSSPRRYQALSNVQAAPSRLQATLGLEPAIEGSDRMPLPELTAAVARALQSWEKGELPTPAATPQEQQSMPRTWLTLALWTVALPAFAGTVPVAATPPSASSSASNAALDKREIRAQLAPRRYTTLAAEIGAKINHLPIPEGASFKAGQTLIQFDYSLQQAQLNKARAALGASDKTRQANRRLAELNSVGKVELDVSEAEVQKTRAELAANAAVLGKCKVSAPFAGRIAEQKVREQQYVQPGQAMLDILDDSALELEFIVPSKWLAWLKPNHSFQVAIDETGKTYPANIQRIGARVDPVSQSVKLSTVIDGKFSELIAGMSGKVLITPPENKP